MTIDSNIIDFNKGSARQAQLFKEVGIHPRHTQTVVQGGVSAADRSVQSSHTYNNKISISDQAQDISDQQAAQPVNPQANDKKEVAQDIDGVVVELNGLAQAIDRQIKFSFNEDANRQQVEIIDKKTGDVIRMIPTEQIMKSYEYIHAAAEELSQEKPEPGTLFSAST